MLFAQELVHLELGHPHTGLGFTLTYPREQQLVLEVFPKGRLRDPVGSQSLAQLRHIDAVLARNVLFGFVDRRLVDFEAVLARQLQLGALNDQSLEHLAGQLCARRLWHPLQGHLLLNTRQTGAYLIVGDRLRVDDRNDEVSRPRRCRCLSPGGSHEKTGRHEGRHPEGSRARSEKRAFNHDASSVVLGEATRRSHLFA